MSEDTRKLSFEGLGEGWVGGEDLMIILEVQMENSTKKFFNKEEFPKVIEMCKKKNFKYDMSLWRRVV